MNNDRISLIISFFLGAALVCMGQVGPVLPAGDTVRVYFASDNLRTDSALVWEKRSPDPGRDPVEQMVDWLLEGPQAAHNLPTLPGGVTLLSHERKGAVLTLNFSKGYGDLSGADLSIANGSVVLTLTQLNNVDSVVILSAGEPVEGSSALPLTAEDFDLSGRSADPITLNLPLYFLSADGSEVVSESRRLQTASPAPADAARAVLEALCAGPERNNLRPSYPPNADGVSVKIENSRCVLNVDGRWLDALLDRKGKPTLTAWALTASLSGLEDIDQIDFRQGGRTVPGLSETEISSVYTPS